MRMRVDPTRHDVTAGRVQLFVAAQVAADLDDLAAVDQNVGLPAQVRRDDGAVLDDCGHILPPLRHPPRPCAGASAPELKEWRVSGLSSLGLRP